MTKLIAPTVIAAGAAAGIDTDIATQGQAKLADTPQAPPPPKTKEVRVRLLVTCAYGKCNDVVSLSAAEANQAEADGVADSHKEAVAYAMSLKTKA